MSFGINEFRRLVEPGEKEKTTGRRSFDSQPSKFRVTSRTRASKFPPLTSKPRLKPPTK